MYIKKLNINLDNTKHSTEHRTTQLDLLFERLCDKFSSNESNQITSIKFILLDKFGYNPMERSEQIKKLCEERDGQNKFREKIIFRDKKCLVTGDNHEICEAAHIIPYSESKSFDIANGVLLNRCFHNLFDKYLFSICSLGCVEFSNQIIGHENYHNYFQYNGKKLNIPNESKKYLSVHWEKFIEINKSIIDN
jgi:hypothetical protein